MVIRLSLLLMSLLLPILGGAVLAESLPDPTRPPGGVDETTSVVVPSGPALQVIRTLDGKRLAIISGQTVKVGGKVGDAIVTRIDEDRVLLRGPEGVQTLKLFPEVEKNPSVSDQIISRSQAKAKAKVSKDHGKSGAVK